MIFPRISLHSKLVPVQYRDYEYGSFILITDYVISHSAAGRIDHGHHAGNAFRALHDAVAMNKAVSKALQMINRGN